MEEGENVGEEGGQTVGEQEEGERDACKESYMR